jgi:hypothetical protein
VIRILPALVVVAACAACNDVRDYQGAWTGARVGDSPVLRVGIADDATADLEIDAVDRHGLSGTLTVTGLVDAAPIASVEGAEADVLAGMTFAGSPLRVYLAFAATSDGGGDALAVIALYDDDRVEIRLLRGGATPLYGVFALRPTPPP